jgi:mannose-1-phosphate guanylyltransferase
VRRVLIGTIFEDAPRMARGPSTPGNEKETKSRPRDRSWAIVLAAGEGQRLARLTRALYGRDVPKQFAALDGEDTMLQQTMARAARVTPEERTVVVVAEHQGALAREQLARCPASRLVEQPRNAGTLCGLLLPLAHVLREDPTAPVVIYPSDHHVSRIGPFVQAVRDALDAIERAPARAVLVGASADRPATDLGWILPGTPLTPNDDARSVLSFVEKPGASAAARLLKSGALWNTLVIALDAGAFWQTTLEARPEADVRREIYAHLPSLDLSRDRLARQSGLGVIELQESGWSDCGTPERLFESLAHGGTLDRLLGRLGGAGVRALALERGAD